MKKLLTLLACVTLLSGCDFVGGDGEAVTFSSLTLTSSPLPADEDGTAPDLYVEIQDASGRAIVKAERVYEDVDAASFPLAIATDGELVGATRDYFVVVMDRNADGYDFIAASEGFNPDELRAAAEPTFEIADNEGRVRAELTLTR